MKNLKKLVSVILIAALMLGVFSGCKKPAEDTNKMPEFIYVPTYNKITLPEGISWLGSMKFIDGRFYTVADMNIEKEVVDEVTGETYTDYTYVQKIISFDEKGEDFKDIAVIGENNRYTQEENFYESVHGFYNTPEGVILIIYRNKSVFNVPEGFDFETGNYWEYEESSTEFIMRKLNSDGTLGEEKVIYSIENINTAENYFYPNYIAAGGNGNWYVGSWEELKVFDKDFNELYSIDFKENNGLNGLFTLKDGRIAAITWGEESMELALVDDAKKALGETYSMPQNVWSISEGSGIYDLVMVTGNGSGLAGMNLGDTEPTKLLDWMDSDIDSNYVYPERVFVVDDENLIAIEEKWNDEGTVYNVVNLKKTPSSELPEKKIITLAAIYLDYDAKEDILEFNRTNPEYRIRVTDYSEYASGEDYYGLTKLNTEIISGNIPDIFITSNMPMDKFAGKGVFEDLVPYIERDIGWDNLVEPFFRALMNDEGKLYEIYSNFRISTYMGHKNVVGDGSSWTFEDFKEAYAKLPEGATVFGEGVTKRDAFGMLFSNNVGNFVDWEKGECRFNSQEFIDILKFTENFPLEFDWESYYEGEAAYYYYDPAIQVASGKQLLSSVNISNINNVRGRTLYILGEDAAFVGLPTNEGSGNSFNLNSVGYAMSATSEHKEVVWKFISEILSEEYQDSENIYRLPTNKKVFDKMMEQQMTPEFDKFYVPEGIVDMYGDGKNPSTGDIIYGDVDVPVAEEEVPETEAEQPEENAFKFELPEFAKGQVNEQGWHEVPKDMGWLENGTSYFEFPIYAMSEYEYNVFMDLINSTTRISRYDESVMNIINEEIEYFFNGDRTAEQTAEYIQSRVNLYVNEQR